MTQEQYHAHHDELMEAARKEMIAFELKEREFRRRAKEDRADELHMPQLKLELPH